jgi:hypothetical protein
METQIFYTLCPSLEKLSDNELADAIVRMCIAHVLNGNAYTNVFDTAIAYLQSIGE